MVDLQQPYYLSDVDYIVLHGLGSTVAARLNCYEVGSCSRQLAMLHAVALGRRHVSCAITGHAPLRLLAEVCCGYGSSALGCRSNSVTQQTRLPSGSRSVARQPSTLSCQPGPGATVSTSLDCLLGLAMMLGCDSSCYCPRRSAHSLASQPPCRQCHACRHHGRQLPLREHAVLSR